MLGLSLNALNLFACPRLCSFSRFRFFMVHFFFNNIRIFTIVGLDFLFEPIDRILHSFFPSSLRILHHSHIFFCPVDDKILAQRAIISDFPPKQHTFPRVEPPACKNVATTATLLCEFFRFARFLDGFFSALLLQKL